MRTWSRAATLTLCGGPCGKSIPAGEPVLAIVVSGVQTAKLRCERCAGEAPPLLPAGVSTRSSVPALAFTRMGQIARPDFKRAAGGDR